MSKGVLGKTLTGLPILALAAAAWVVTLAGLAIARHAGGESGLGFLWFIWAFEGFVLFFCILHLIEVGAGFSLAHAATASLLAVVTVLTILETETLNTLRKATGNSSSLYHKGIVCAFAGFLALSALNLLLVIVLGTNHRSQTSTHKDGQQNTSQGVVTGTQGYGTAPAASQGYGAPTTMV